MPPTTILLLNQSTHPADAEEHQQFALFLAERLNIFVHVCPVDGLAAGVTQCLQTGVQRVLILPYLLFTARVYQLLEEEARTLAAQHNGCQIIVANPLRTHSDAIDAIVRAFQDALSGKQTSARRGGAHTHRSGIQHSHDVDRALEAMLPPRYRDNAQVSAAPMAAVSLQYGVDGLVAWDKMWTGYCELALAGGPPHRGELLEPPLPTTVNRDPDGYEWVLSEIERGISLVTGLTVVRSKAPGWIGVRCESEEMALWMLRAIIVENICIRREGKILYLPAAPHFRLEAEIKNVVTAVAKTHHYWVEHISSE